MSSTYRSVWLAFAVLATTVFCGCAVRYVTESTWRTAPDNTSLYMTYWEGSCVQVGAKGREYKLCSAGDGKVKRCTLGANNGLSCVNEADAEKALNP